MVQHEARAARVASRAAADEARRERERRRRAQEARRPAANVIMSDSQRQAVEGALAHTRAAQVATHGVTDGPSALPGVPVM